MNGTLLINLHQAFASPFLIRVGLSVMHLAGLIHNIAIQGVFYG